MADEFSLVIRRGTVVDGTGSAPFEADIAIADGKIAEIGKVSAKGIEEIDAHGLLVTPGFVDIHTHYDGQATWDSRLQPSSYHGVTTVVMGNCGVGFAPVRKHDHEKLIELMEGVEDIPETALHAGLQWNWESFEDYMNVLDSRPHDMDIGAQLPHAPLRVYVMGDRAVRLEPATADDIAQMRKITEQAMRAGAVGFATSRSMRHKSVKGDPTPSLRAMEDELIGIALGMADAGRGVIELLSDFDEPDLETEFALLRRVVERSGRPLSFSVAQTPEHPHKWRKLLALIDQAVADGLPMRAQISPRALGVLLGLQGSLNPFTFCPSFAVIDNLPLEEKVAAMRDPAMRAKLIAEKPVSNDVILNRVRAFDRMFLMGEFPNYEPSIKNSITSIAAERGVSPMEAAYDALLENDGRSFMIVCGTNFVDGNLDACREMIANPNTLIGLGDGGAHVGFIADASIPTYMLSHWGRDRTHGRFDIPTLIKRLTKDGADAVGMYDRGVLASGKKADINIIDFAKLQAGLPHMVFDLPANGKRLMQQAEGYAATIVSGEVTYRNGEPTKALPGRLVRNAQDVRISTGS